MAVMTTADLSLVIYRGLPGRHLVKTLLAPVTTNQMTSSAPRVLLQQFRPQPELVADLRLGAAC